MTRVSTEKRLRLDRLIDSLSRDSADKRSFTTERAEAEAIGRLRSGRTTKCHGVCDEHGRLRRSCLTAGQHHDMVAAWELVDEARLETRALIADRATTAKNCVPSWTTRR